MREGSGEGDESSTDDAGKSKDMGEGVRAWAGLLL